MQSRASETGGGIQIDWGAVHKNKDGEIISRQASIETPKAPTCLRPSCLWRYLLDSIRYVLIANYHAKRVAYAEAKRHSKIPQRYRTGEPAPSTILGGIYANIKLTCPVCRKF